ncbi:hypothetical protein CASFOL_002775 [Castilleja foliolosa]|uniref:Uncharacterized protein n=1 Tax=Castilleja foliolosa TaxID=1961234 RepID=A0ABD3EIP6_9LAMI
MESYSEKKEKQSSVVPRRGQIKIRIIKSLVPTFFTKNGKSNKDVDQNILEAQLNDLTLESGDASYR